MSLAVISPDAPEMCERTLRKRGFDIIKIAFCKQVDPRIGFHPDIQLFTAGGRVFVHPDLPPSSVRALSRHTTVTVCSKALGGTYPMDCSYNIAFTGETALCRKDLLPHEIADFFAAEKIQVIDVPQGYARCSTVVTGSRSIITEDRGIATAAAEAGLTAVTVTPGFVALKGFSRGFLGGATGTFNGTVFLTGSLSEHPDYAEILSAISTAGKNAVALCDTAAEDFGSILFI